MLSKSDMNADSRWANVQPQLASLAAFTALKRDQDRRQLFQDYVDDLQVRTLHLLSRLQRLHVSNHALLMGCQL